MALAASTQAVTVSELMYHPLGDAPDNDVYGEEYIELYNETNASIDLGGYRFTRGISGPAGEPDYAIPPNTVVPAGGYLVVAKDPAAMIARGVPRVIGPYGGHFRNTGERVTLVDKAGIAVVDFAYADGGDWPAAGDGTGHSIVLNDPTEDPDRGRNWHHSLFIGGSPGRADTPQPQTLHLVTAPDSRSQGCPTECSRYHYFKGFSEPAANWKSQTFNEAGWLQGCGGWGYGDNDDCTELTDMQRRYISVYARATFDLTAQQIAWMKSLTLEVRYDDGFVAYLNEDEADRASLEGDPPSYDAAASPCNEPTTQIKDLTGKIGTLDPGLNVLALQGHNCDLRSSSDVSLIARLTAEIVPPGGGDDPARQVVINEIFADGGGTEWIELYNPGTQTIVLDGAWLSNSEDHLGMEALPVLTRIEPGRFLLLQGGYDFQLSLNPANLGGQVFLSSPSLGYVLAAYEFGPQTAGRSIGRYPDGALDWHATDQPSPGEGNARRRLSEVVINEIMYHAPSDETADYLEVFNGGPAAVDLSGWEFAGVGYRFPQDTVLSPGAYAVICDDVAVAAANYGLDATKLFGNYRGSLSNAGEKIVLLDANDLVVDWVRYGDDPPWPVTPDGSGASLERRCTSTEFDQPSDWTGSPVNAPSPAVANRITDCTVLPTPPVVINEIMKHPYAEFQDDSRTEFIELLNTSNAPVPLTGWTLGGDIGFAFPDGLAIPANGFLVLSAVDAAGRTGPGGLYTLYPALSNANTLGPYSPELPNGGADVWLIGPDGRVVDAVHYKDDFPWPTAVDGYGQVEGKGYSLERRCPQAASDDPANWDASPKDQPSPGAVNTRATCSLPPTVVDLDVQPEPVTATVSPTLLVVISPVTSVQAVSVEYFVDDLQAEDEPVSSLPMVAGANGTWSATLPARPAHSIVRYRIRIDAGGGMAVASPRPNADVYAWHAYFVDPLITSNLPPYHLFITPANWRTLFDNSSPGRVINSRVNPRWDDEVPATFVAGGKVYDVTVRLQGSRWNRLGGWDIGFPCPSHATNGTARVLSWRIRFPSYRNHDGIDVLILQKQDGWPQRVSFHMFELAGVPAPRTDWVNLRINGCAYNDRAYQIERNGTDLAQRWFGEVGDLFKSQGFTGDEGPWSWGDERLIVGPLNGYTEEERYEYTYDRETLTWKSRPGDGNPDLIEPLIEGLHQAREQGTTALRAYLAAHFDVDMTLRYIATINYVGTFDDMFQNHFLYRRASDGKWLMFPWDMDNTLGGAYGEYNAHWLRGANRSDVGNREGWWNRIKDSFFLAYEPEYVTTLLYLNNEVYPPEVMTPIINEIAAVRGLDPSGLRNHIQARHDWLNANVVLPVCRGDPPVVVGTLSQFAITGPDEAIINRTTKYGIAAAVAGSAAPVDVQLCVTWSTDRPDIATIDSFGRLNIQTDTPPATLELRAATTDNTGPVTATRTVRLVFGPTLIDLGAIVGGGDGLSPPVLSFMGINPVTGRFEPGHVSGMVGDGASQPQPVPAPPGAAYDLVDSAFVLNGDVAINTAGVRWGDANWTNPLNPYFPGTYDFILNNLESDALRPLQLREGGQVVKYSMGLGIHSSAGVTYDLTAIANRADADLLRLQAKFGSHPGCGGTVEGFAIFSNGTSVLAAQRSGVRNGTSEAFAFDVAVPAGARYLTLAVGAAGDGIGCDHGIFGDAVLLGRSRTPHPYDFDQDGDIDGNDVTLFRACVSGPQVPRTASCQSRDLDSDGDVDQSDFGRFQPCFTGANQPADLNCGR